jgi:hypothetical protein
MTRARLLRKAGLFTISDGRLLEKIREGEEGSGGTDRKSGEGYDEEDESFHQRRYAETNETNQQAGGDFERQRGD